MRKTKLAAELRRDVEKNLNNTEFFLLRFIMRKHWEHNTPESVNLVKGDRVNFSSEKYLACLFMLYNISDKDRAALASVSYDVIRQWKTETPFKNQAWKLAHEFAGVFKERIKQVTLDSPEFAEINMYSIITMTVIAQVMAKAEIERHNKRGLLDIHYKPFSMPEAVLA